jgi:hypothetical protein
VNAYPYLSPCPALPPQTIEDHFVVLRYPRSFLCGLRATRRDLRKLCVFDSRAFCLTAAGPSSARSTSLEAARTVSGTRSRSPPAAADGERSEALCYSSMNDYCI